MMNAAVNQKPDVFDQDPDTTRAILHSGPIEILIMVKHSEIKAAADMVDTLVQSSHPLLDSLMSEIVFKPSLHIVDAFFEYSYSTLVYGGQSKGWIVRLHGVTLSDDGEPFTADFALNIKSLM
jgi:hypothetical protein